VDGKEDGEEKEDKEGRRKRRGRKGSRRKMKRRKRGEGREGGGEVVSALGGEWCHAPATLPTEERPVPIDKETKFCVL
jgi:hypothetical protein